MGHPFTVCWRAFLRLRCCCGRSFDVGVHGCVCMCVYVCVYVCVCVCVATPLPQDLVPVLGPLLKRAQKLFSLKEFEIPNSFTSVSSSSTRFGEGLPPPRLLLDGSAGGVSILADALLTVCRQPNQVGVCWSLTECSIRRIFLFFSFFFCLFLL